MSWPDDIRGMHALFGVREAVDRMDGPTLGRFLRFRVDFLGEELDELRRSADPGDAVDALVDLCVVALGTLDALGVDAREAWGRVLEANLAKRVGVKPGRPNPLGLPDLVKPPGWTAPAHDGNVGRFPEALAAALDLDRDPAARRDRRYAALARHVAGWSKDPSTRVGAVLVGVDRRDIAVGYNGFPPGVRDDPGRLADPATRYALTQHAERNVLDNARFRLAGATLYVTAFPCGECAKSIVSRGVARVVCPPAPAPDPARPWTLTTGTTRDLLAEVGVAIDDSGS